MSKHYSRKTKGRSKDKKGITKKLGTIFDNAQKAVDDFFEEERHRKRIKKASKMLGLPSSIGAFCHYLLHGKYLYSLDWRCWRSN